MEEERNYTAFMGERQIVSGEIKKMLLVTKSFIDRNKDAQVLIFDDQTGRQVDFDFRGTPDDVLARISEHPLFKTDIGSEKREIGPGRPKLGVVCREVSLLPRHWDWLEEQPGGISASIRKLVDEARKREPDKEKARNMRNAASRIMTVLAGNLPGYEEASRALFSGNTEKFENQICDWPQDICGYLQRIILKA
jgi:hypothetical protein